MITFFRARRGLFAGIVAGLTLAAAGAQAQDYPSRPIKLLVGYAAGGPVDIGARQLAALLQKSLGQSVFIDNKPGAGGTLAGAENARAAADGYTLFFTASPTQTMTPHLLGKMPYDPLREYTPISLISMGHNVLMVRADSPIRSLADLVAYARANPGKAAFGSAGIGASNHLAAELLARRSGTQMLHVPYKGNSQAMIALIGGETTFQFAGSTDALEHVRSGRVRALVVTAPARMRVVPEVPTMAEAGYPDFNVSVWYALEGPPALPANIVNRLTNAVTEALRDPAYQKTLADSGFDLVGASGAVLAQRVTAEYQQWADVIKNLKPAN